MKESNMNIFENAKLREFKDDPTWFKKSILQACTRTYDGKIGHVEYMEIADDDFKTRPIVTTLKYIRVVVPDSIDPFDDKINIEGEHLDENTCIVLTLNDDGEYVEPLSGFVVSDPGIKGYSPEEIYKCTIEKGIYLVLTLSGEDFSPFGYVSDEVLKIWKESTVPYADEIMVHFERIKRRTENNFGESFLGTEEIEKALNFSKK
ncbi:MAG: hypothetical protein K2I70_03105 [Bacilli bacterium]|nr:hypothetical protein [Bacilli bacterium]